MGRPKHPNKVIERAIVFAEQHHWRYQASGRSSHAWGRLLCPLKKQAGCRVSIFSTPRNPDTHAMNIMKTVGKCVHIMEVIEHV